MKLGKSINRPVQARHLELYKRRRDYKIHLRTIREQKCATDFSQPPPIFRFETILQNDCIKRRERKQYEDMCIEKINEHYANKIINSNSFHDPDLIQQVTQRRGKKISKSSFQYIPSQTNTKSIKSSNSNNNSLSENFKEVHGYIIPHYDLPTKFLDMKTNSDENDKLDIKSQPEINEQEKIKIHLPKNKSTNAPHRTNNSSNRKFNQIKKNH